MIYYGKTLSSSGPKLTAVQYLDADAKQMQEAVKKIGKVE